MSLSGTACSPPRSFPRARVTTVHAGLKSVALVHFDGKFSALDNHCPHQGGPLCEGSIESGLLRCPWRGFDYCPLTGKSPGFDDEATTYALEVRDGEIFVGVEEPGLHVETVSDVMARTMVKWGVKHMFGSRSILGFMNDSALACRYSVEHAGALEHADLDDLNRSLRRQLHNRGGYHQPLDLVLERLTAG